MAYNSLPNINRTLSSFAAQIAMVFIGLVATAPCSFCVIYHSIVQWLSASDLQKYKCNEIPELEETEPAFPIIC